MRYKILFILMVLMVASYADQTAEVGQNNTVWCSITENNNFYNATSANITIKDDNSKIIINNQPMQKNSTGQFSYQFIPNSTGAYLQYCYFYDGGTLKGLAQQTVSVVGAVTPEFSMMWIIFLLFAIGILLAVSAVYLRNPFMYIASGVWFLMNAYYNFNNIEGLGAYSMLFFILVALVLIWQGISIFIASGEENG